MFGLPKLFFGLHKLLSLSIYPIFDFIVTVVDFHLRVLRVSSCQGRRLRQSVIS